MLVDPGFVWRVVKAGWINRTITHILNTVRKWLDICSRSAVLTAVRNAMSANTGDDRWGEQKWRASNPDSDASQVDFGALACHALPDTEKEDIKISDLTKDVLVFPKNNDRGTLTEAIELVCRNPQLDRNLADINSLITEQRLSIVVYNADKDRICKDHWTNVSDQTFSRTYDATNRSTLGGKRKR
jgi:hypothetical protein